MGLVVAIGVLYPLRGYSMPVGPDAPVYLWWTRLAGYAGLSAVTRPGVPALALSLASIFHVSVALTYAALGASLGAAAGLAAAALVGRGEAAAHAPRATILLVGGLAGAFAVHLAAGYEANLAWAVCLLGAAASLTIRTRGALVAAAALFAASGLAHPLFWFVGLVVLLLALPGTRPANGNAMPFLDTERGRVLATVGGGAIAFGLSMAAASVGPPPLTVPTSKDAYLKRDGMLSELHAAYRTRFFAHWLRYLLPLTVPVAWTGLRREPRSTAYRILRAWALVVAAGVALGLITAWIPPERFLTSAFVLPIGVGLGATTLWKGTQRSRIAAVLVVSALTMVTAWTWWQNHPFFDMPGHPEAVGTAFAGEVAEAADHLPPGTQIFVDVGSTTDDFEGARIGNVIRAGIPAEHIPFLIVFFGNLPAPPTTPTTPPLILEARPTDGPPPQPLVGFSPWAVIPIALGQLAALVLAGFGWCQLATRRDAERKLGSTLALAPALGVAALMLNGMLVDRLGLRLDGLGGVLAYGLAAASGYLGWFIRQRSAGP